MLNNQVNSENCIQYLFVGFINNLNFIKVPFNY